MYKVFTTNATDSMVFDIESWVKIYLSFDYSACLQFAVDFFRTVNVPIRVCVLDDNNNTICDLFNSWPKCA